MMLCVLSFILCMLLNSMLIIFAQLFFVLKLNWLLKLQKEA